MLESDYQALVAAKQLLEQHSFLQRVLEVLGKPAGFALRQLPGQARQTLARVVNTSLARAVDMACWSLSEQGRNHKRAHWAAVVGTGAVAGAFGLAGLAVDLPLTTTLMLRSIAQIAREQGENLALPESRLACVQVLGMGAGDLDGGYLGVRALLAREIQAAAAWLGSETAARQGASPLLAQLVEKLATRFGVVVEEKLAAQMVPVIGALGGATINALFMSFFQDKAQGHFTYRRLERTYGAEVVRVRYQEIDIDGLDSGGQKAS